MMSTLHLTQLALTALLGLLSGILSSTVGMGGGLLLLAIMTLYLPAKAAVAVSTAAMLWSNLNRAFVFRERLSARLLLPIVAASAPAAVLGSYTLYLLPDLMLKRLLGGFVLGFLLLGRPWRGGSGEAEPARALEASEVQTGPAVLAAGGLATGYMSGALGVSGPLNTVFLLSLGLAKEAFVGCNAVLSISAHLPKTFAYSAAGLFPEQWPLLLAGLLPALSVGTLIGQSLLHRLSEGVFRAAICAVLAISAARLLLG